MPAKVSGGHHGQNPALLILWCSMANTVSQISTRHMYNTDLEFFRRNDRGIPMSLGQNPHIPDQYETSSHLSSRTTPSSEPDSRTSSGARKRVPVAVCLSTLSCLDKAYNRTLAHDVQCERCRRRKIKCSGNEGDNQSCTNCRNSGHHQDCRFSRVSLPPDMHSPRSRRD